MQSKPRIEQEIEEEFGVVWFTVVDKNGKAVLWTDDRALALEKFGTLSWSTPDQQKKRKRPSAHA